MVQRVRALALLLLAGLCVAGCDSSTGEWRPPVVQRAPAPTPKPAPAPTPPAAPTPPDPAAVSTAGQGGPATPAGPLSISPIQYTTHISPRGLDVRLPTWLSQNPFLAPTIVAELLEEFDKTTPQGGSGSIHDYPGAYSRTYWVWGGGASFAPADWVGSRILGGYESPTEVLVCWKSHTKVISNDPWPNVRLPALAHELGHVAETIPDDCALCGRQF